MSKVKHPSIFVRNNPASPQLCPELAKEIGLNESILLLQLEYWLTKHGEIRDDGHLWIRKPVREIQETFNFWSVGTINSIIESLVRKRYVATAGLDKARGRSGRWLRLCLTELATLKSIRVCSESELSMFKKDPDLVQDRNNRPYIGFKDKEREREGASDSAEASPTGYKQPRKTKVLLPEGYAVTDGMRNWAHGIGLSDERIDAAHEQYVRDAQKKVKRFYPEHWVLDWEQWMLRESQFSRNGNSSGNGHGAVVNDQPMLTIKERMRLGLL